MRVRITKPPQGGTVHAIASKSAAHRLLIAAALAKEDTRLRCPSRSEDIDATARCLDAMGAGIRYEGDMFYITPIKKDGKIKGARRLSHNTERILPCGESGATFRFLLPVCAAMGLKAAFQLEGRLPDRPLTGLYEEMAAHGCTLSAPGSPIFTCAGTLKRGSYALPGNISSQFVSGLLLALPALKGDSSITLTGPLESRPYVDMTLEALKSFQINIKTAEGPPLAFTVPGGQVYHSPGEAEAEGDWSNAAFWLAAGALVPGGVTCTGLNPHSVQGDKAITELLSRFGARVIVNKKSVTVSPGTLNGITVNAADTPDLVPVLAAIASAAEGTTVINGAGRLRLKESDRLRSVTASLAGLGADIKETEDGLIIHGKQHLPGGVADAFGDHRIAMVAAFLSVACSGPVVINGAEAVNKSYPAFFGDFKTVLGGAWEAAD